MSNNPTMVYVFLPGRVLRSGSIKQIPTSRKSLILHRLHAVYSVQYLGDPAEREKCDRNMFSHQAIYVLRDLNLRSDKLHNLIAHLNSDLTVTCGLHELRSL